VAISFAAHNGDCFVVALLAMTAPTIKDTNFGNCYKPLGFLQYSVVLRALCGEDCCSTCAFGHKAPHSRIIEVPTCSP
jgi:hypothetical protein